MLDINDSSLWLLLVSTATIGFVHTLAPDHWVPFVSMARARKWSQKRLIWVTLCAGTAHVLSSILIGSVGLALGFSLTHLEALEGNRAEVAGLLLLSFGLAYAVWGFKRAHRHDHDNLKSRKVTIWALFIIFFLGPCEPLIPLMFAAFVKGWAATAAGTLLFFVITVGMMLGQVLLAYRGAKLFSFKKLEAHGHGVAGLVIVFTGLAVMVLGI